MFTNLKQKKEALTNKFDRFFSFDDKVKMVQAGSALATSLCCMSMISMAAVNTADIFGTLIGYICQIFLYIGINVPYTTIFLMTFFGSRSAGSGF